MDVALTFDVEHPDQSRCDPATIETILDALAELRIRGTFFVQGAWAGAYPHMARRIAGDGHLLGLHSHWHAPYRFLTPQGRKADLTRGHKALTDATGHDPRPWFRLPYGNGDQEVVDWLADEGFTSVHWNVDPRDWDPSGSPAEIGDAILEGIAEQQQLAVVLFHSWSAATAEVIRNAARRAQSDYRLVTVDEIDPQMLAHVPHGYRWGRRKNISRIQGVGH